MADYEIFREQLAIKYPSFGYALWQPRPTNPNRPVQVGDVGFIREGKFHRLFSALLPADDPSQELGVPENHERLVPTLSDHVDTVPLGCNNYCSAGVKVEADPGYLSGPDDLPQVSFRNVTTRTAALLALPVIARHENTLIRNVFGRWMVRHIDTWFAFARNLGLIDQMEEMILVTGCDLTRSWINVAFLGGFDAQVSFGVQVEGPNTSINFQFSPEHARGATLHHGPEGTNLPENQCVFIRGYRVAPSLWILPKRLKAAAGPSSGPGGYDGDSDMKVISIPAITQSRDPLLRLSDYIAEQVSDCDKILVHDDDLLMIDGIGHGTLLETLEPDVMVDHFRKSDIKIHKFGCDSFLTESQSGPNIYTFNNVKVATLSTVFQNWNPNTPAPSPPSPIQRRAASPIIDWSSPSSVMQGPVTAYPQGGSSQRSGRYRSDNDTYPSGFRQQGNSTPSVLQDECHAWFIAIDQDGRGELSSEELSTALLSDGALRFSANTVEYLMSIFDSDGSGVVTYEDFEPLWIYMVNWRKMFDSFDGDRDGRIDATLLGGALEHYNLRVGSHVLDKLVKKYGIIPSRNRGPFGQHHNQPRPQMDLDHFVCASVVVRQMCDLYERYKGGGESQITRDDFLKSVISLP